MDEFYSKELIHQIEMLKKYNKVALSKRAEAISLVFTDRIRELDENAFTENFLISATIGFGTFGAAAIYHGKLSSSIYTGTLAFVTAFAFNKLSSFLHQLDHDFCIKQFNYALSLSSNICLSSIERYAISKIELLNESESHDLCDKMSLHQESNMCEILGATSPFLQEIFALDIGKF